jgi:hypothetical protein
MDSSHENKPMHRMRHMITDLIKKSSSTSETHRHANKNVEPSKSTPLVNVTYTSTITPDKIESSIMDTTEKIDLNASKSCPNVKKRKSVFDALDSRSENESNEKRKLLPNNYDSNKKGPKVNFDKELFSKMENFARKPNSNTFNTDQNECKNTDQNAKTNVSNAQVSLANKNDAEPLLKKHKAINNNLVPPLKPEKVKPPSRPPPPPPLPNKIEVQSQLPPPPPPPMLPFNTEKVKPVSSTKPSAIMPKATNSIKVPPPPPNTSLNLKEKSAIHKTTLVTSRRNETPSVSPQSLSETTKPPSFLDEIKRLNGLEGLKNMKKKKVLQAPKTANHASYLNNALEVMRPHMSIYFIFFSSKILKLSFDYQIGKFNFCFFF